MTSNPTLTAPLTFTGETAPSSGELSRRGQDQVSRILERQISTGLPQGAQLVVLRHGRVALDLAAGLAQVRRRMPVTAETPFLVYSATKPFTAVCIHRLVEEGRVVLDAPIATYWPEFGVRGKEAATVRHALLHQAGIPVSGLYGEVLLCANWNRVTRYVAGLKADFVPGTQTAYHLLNYGYLLGEVVRRVSGQPIEVYLRENFLDPLGLRHSWLGLPPDQRKQAADIYGRHREQWGAAVFFNLPYARRSVIPAASLNSSARDLAVFYQMLLNGGKYAGRYYLQPETIAHATALSYDGYDATLRGPTRWGLGFRLGGPSSSTDPDTQPMGKGSTPRTFGHMGQGASAIGWADPEADLVFAFTCNRLLTSREARARLKALADAVWDALD